MRRTRDLLGFTRDQRLALILAELATTTRSWTTAAQLREVLFPYTTEANARVSDTPENTAKGKLETDLHTLAERGLIESRWDGNGHQLEVRSVLPQKDAHASSLRFSREEHAALARARRQLRPGVARVSPYAIDASAEEWDDIDKCGALVRYLEETGDELSLDEVAVFLGSTNKRQVVSLLSILGELDSLFDNTVQVVTLTEVEDDDADEALPVVGVRLSVDRLNEPGKRGKGGMNAQGRFEYSLPETEERLSLIEQARGEVPDEDWELLWSAGEKLRAWRELLLQATSVSTD